MSPTLPSETNPRWRHATGRAAEDLAARHLEEQGCRLLARHFACRGGEIDLIVEDAGVIVFVEVKARPTFDQTLQAIGRQQRTRIARAASLFIAAHPAFASLTMRYAVMVVLPWRLPRHVSGAWTD